MDTAKQRKRAKMTKDEIAKMTKDEFIESFKEALERLGLESEVIVTRTGTTDNSVQFSIPQSWGAEKTEKVFNTVREYMQNKNKQNREKMH